MAAASSPTWIVFLIIVIIFGIAVTSCIVSYIFHLFFGKTLALIFFACFMASELGISQGIISCITVAVQVLWIGIPRHYRVRTQELVNIRQTRLFKRLNEKGWAESSAFHARDHTCTALGAVQVCCRWHRMSNFS